MRIVFVHGWASDAGIWDDIAPYFENAQCVEIGFTGRRCTEELPDEPALYVTHSLGTMWALRHAREKIAGLVALGGFACFNAFTDSAVIEAMKRGIDERPQIQLKSFCKMAGMNIPKNYDTARLKEGLDWLGQWDERGEYDFPTIALAGEADKIVPLSAAQAQWGERLQIIGEASHNLPQQNANTCINAMEKMLEML